VKAARFVQAGDELVITDIPKPTPRMGESLIAVRAVGLCGSDVHITQGHTPTAYAPITIGHEISGVVVDINGGETDARVGDHVFVNPMVGCGECRFCISGDVNFCASRSIIGIQREGALAEFVVAPTANLTVMPPELAFPEIALIESAGTANHAVRVLDVTATDAIVVIGTGGLGMQALRLAVARGARVFAVDSDPVARERSLAAGAEQVFDPAAGEDLPAVILEAAGLPGGVDGVIDCVGIEPTFTTALNLLRLNGHVAIVGIGGRALTLTPPAHFMRRALRVSGIYGYSNRDIAEVSAHLIDGSLDLRASVSATLPLEQVNEGIRMFVDRENSPVRIVIEPAR